MNKIVDCKSRCSNTTKTAALLMAAFFCSVLPARSQKNQFPDGNGKGTIISVCGKCHSLNWVVRQPREGWQDTVDTMISFGADLKKDDVPVIVDYLAKNFWGPPKRPSVVIPGSVEVSIKEWTVPTRGSRPHDPGLAPDGSVWYVGSRSNTVGRFDPQSTKFKEYALKIPRSAPNGLDIDKDGNVWFAAIGAAYMGKLDPKTGDVTEYKMPDPSARGPHTPIFDQKGTLWFTIASMNGIGRIMPKTGELKFGVAPTPKARPYGITINNKGVPFFTEFDTNRLGSIDPVTMEIKEYVLPNPETRPRRLAVTPDDVVWYTDYARGYLGRYDPKTGKASEWPSPSGATSGPYGILTVGDIVWYSEAEVKPNTLVRFDPKTEKFQSWAIPSGGGVVRHMVAEKDGTLWLACSGVNGIARVEVK